MSSESLKEVIKRELPGLLREAPSLREYILELTRQEYAGRAETQDRFYEILTELRQDREEQTCKWEEQNRRGDEQTRKWYEQNRLWREQWEIHDQVELDVIIRNGVLLICELKSSMDKAGMYAFERKARFYENRHQRKANRLIVISPMIDPKAQKVAEKLGIDTYSDSLNVESL